MAPILSEHGSDESCGLFGVEVKRTQSKFNDSASMEVHYDELIDYECTPHQVVVAWNGGKASVDDVIKLLYFAKVPLYVQNVSAVDMILRLVDEIHKEDVTDEKGVKLDSVKVYIITDKDTADYSEFAEFFVQDDD